ncbi:hypothetical protein AXX17_AT1G35380 [Arabidopsis thaliana]|uniref:Uncharacterized protein n=1 Tax=Arabidopsis thaliana TaxID=3702 RepID=A0A178W6G4_ARATH|nr:hypothetical protein AXX17_AT1G35380 [Arabidopsis thaliana]
MIKRKIREKKKKLSHLSHDSRPPTPFVTIEGAHLKGQNQSTIVTGASPASITL